MRLLIVQFGHYAPAAREFARGGDENYYAQRYTVEFVARIAEQGHAVRVLALGEDALLERLPSGVESDAIKIYPGRFQRTRVAELVRAAEQWQPTHLLLCSPIPRLLRWAVRNRVETLPMFADSFAAKGLRQRLFYWTLAAALNAPAIRWVSNHGINAAADLVRIGVHARKVVPFDWPAFPPTTIPAAKTAPRDPRALRLVYVGRLVESKGVGDLIDAVALAKTKGENHSAIIVGGGDQSELRAHAAEGGVEGRITFEGAVPRTRVFQLMNEADVVVVPSRHEYPEGMPMTIYEGLCSRSPILVSDHPMFIGRIEHAKNGMMFRAGNAAALLAALRELVDTPGLYARLSQNAETVCATFFGPLKWDQLITRWLGGTPDDDAWLAQYALAQSKS